MIILDENLPVHAARMLEAFDNRHEVRSILDHQPKGTGDLEILQFLGETPVKPALITQDGRILHNPTERAMPKDVDLSVVFLAAAWTRFPWPEKAWKLVKVWPTVTHEITRSLKPSTYELQGGSSLKLRRLCATSEL